MGKSSLKKNFIYNSVYQILLVVLPLITSPYISRVLGDEGLGIYSYTYTIANCFSLVGMLGVNNYGNRTIAACRDNRIERSRNFWSIWLLQVLLSLIVTGIYFIYVFSICGVEYRTVSVVQYLTVACSLFDINWFFFGLEKFKLTVTRNIIIKIASVVCIFVFVKLESDIWVYSLIIAGSLLLSNLVIWPFLRKEVDFVRPSFDEIIKHLPHMAVLFVPVIAITLYNKMDKVMLGVMSTMSETGLYENTEKIINIPLGLITALGTVMLPRISYLVARGEKNEASKYFALSLEFATAMSFSLMFGLAAISQRFAPWFFGESFASVGTLIILLAPKIIFLSIANVVRTQYLIPMHKDKIFVFSVWIGAVANLIINVLLIPGYGAAGAIVGTVVAEFSVMLYQIFAIREDVHVLKMLMSLWPYLLAAVIMYWGVRFVNGIFESDFLAIVIQIFVGVVIYGVICVPILLKRHNDEVRDIFNHLKGRGGE